MPRAAGGTLSPWGGWGKEKFEQGCWVMSAGSSITSRLGAKLQYFGHLMRRADSLEKTLTLGGHYLHTHTHTHTHNDIMTFYLSNLRLCARSKRALVSDSSLRDCQRQRKQPKLT